MNRFFTRTKIGIRTNVNQLKEEYKELMKQYHPDRNITRNSSYNEDIAPQITTMYSILKKDGSRCKYLLAQKGYNLSDTYVQFKLDNHLLEDLMYMSETIEYEQSKQELDKLQFTLSEQKQTYLSQLDTLWNNEKYAECLPGVYHISYIERLEEQLMQKCYELDIKKC